MVQKGFNQNDMDYLDILTLVAKMNFIQVILSIIILKDWKFYQLDVENTFLDSELEEVYICTSLRYEREGKYCKLMKALYRLKQSPKV